MARARPIIFAMQRKRHIWQKLGDLGTGLVAHETPDAVVWRVATRQDIDALGELMLNAYRGTLDDEGESLEQARDEVRRLFDRSFGPAEAAACTIGERDGEPVCASLCCLWDGGGHVSAGPLIAYVVTAPAHQGHRLGAAAVWRSLRTLAQAGHEQIYAVISDGNHPSEATFRRLGFEALTD
jgi:predicted N-acetyltransferase YhbS